jgi:hypothetical protein
LGKRSDYSRKPRDYYPTPLAAVLPLIPHLPASFTFCEPCAGDGRLVEHVESAHEDASCITAYDIEPQAGDVEDLDALALAEEHVSGCDVIITNPPWDRKILHPMIERFSDLRPTWLLFDADWIHTIQSAELVRSRLCKIVSVGRVKWIEDSAGSGKDNAAWYLFDRNKSGETEFHGRQPKK